MRFKRLYKILFLAALLADVADYAITQLALTRFPPFFEANPLIRALMVGYLSLGMGGLKLTIRLPYPLNPHLASTTVFLISLVLVVGAYWLTLGYFREEPYTGSLRDVGGYLWRSESVRSRDILIFFCIALFLIITHQHLVGFYSWIATFTRLGA